MIKGNFDNRNHVQEGTPQRLEESLAKNKPSEGEVNELMALCFSKRRKEFPHFLPVFMKHGASINALESESTLRLT